MNPKDFLKTAEYLQRNSSEPNLRSSISRSYYGLFLFFREYLELNNIKKSDENRVHTFVRDCFKACRVQNGKYVAESLKELLERRKIADYELGPSHSVPDAADALRIADETIQDFEQLDPAIKKVIVTGAREFAKNNGGIVN